MKHAEPSASCGCDSYCNSLTSLSVREVEGEVQRKLGERREPNFPNYCDIHMPSIPFTAPSNKEQGKA